MFTEEMQMASGDPTALLDAMDMLLGEHGDIKTPQEVSTVINLMKDAEKLLNRCIFMHILGATLEHAPGNPVGLETVHRFVREGGCAILNKWLSEAKEVENVPIILEVLELLEAMPVTVEALKQGNMGKLVKQLTKSEETEVKELASSLLKKWMVLVKGKPKKNKKQEVHADDSSNSGSPAAKRSRENSSESKTKQPPEKKAKSLAEAKSSVTSVAKPAVKAKIIPALPKPIVMESSGFMNALIQQTVPKIKKKKKVAPPPSPKEKQSYAGPLEEILQNQSQTHGEEKDKTDKDKEKDKEKEKDEEKEKVEEKDNEKTGEVEEKEKEEESEKGDNETPKSPQPIGGEDKSVVEPTAALSEKTNATSGLESDAIPSPNEVVVSEVVENPDEEVQPMETDQTIVEVEAEEKRDAPKKKKKRNIRWAEDDKLLQYHYYEPNEEEKVVQHVVNFHDAQHQENIRERQRVEQAKRLSEDKMCEKLNWYRPKRFANREEMERGESSQEKLKQRERESKILPDLFFSKSSLPVSAGEPDPETHTGPTPQPLVIPHDEKGTVYPPSKSAANVAVAIPPPVGNQIQTPSLPPALAALLANATKVQGNQTNPLGSGTNAALSNVDVQDLLKKLMGSTQNPDDQGALEESAKRLQNELSYHGPPRFPSPLMGQQLRVPGRMPGDQGLRPRPQEQLRQGVPDFRGRSGILGNPGSLPERMRFPGPMRGGPLRGRFIPPGGPRLRQSMPGQRMPVMGRGGMMTRFQVPDGKQASDHEGGNHEGPGPMMGPRGRGMRPRGRPPPMCRHFMSPRGCLRNNACPFLHPGVNAPPL